MKRRNLSKTLSLNKETVTNLNTEGMNTLRGGTRATQYLTCGFNCNTGNISCANCSEDTRCANCETNSKCHTANCITSPLTVSAYPCPK